ncbi:MAG: FctA domain-containing protein [Slackia sp.]|nr:FctA domain-containing protein [Slackia sp.]
MFEKLKKPRCLVAIALACMLMSWQSLTPFTQAIAANIGEAATQTSASDEQSTQDDQNASATQAAQAVEGNSAVDAANKDLAAVSGDDVEDAPSNIAMVGEPASNTSDAQHDEASTPSVQSEEYNGNSDYREVISGIKVNVYKDDGCSEELASDDVIAPDAHLYGKVFIDFATKEMPTLAQPNIKYTFPNNVKFENNDSQTLYDGDNRVAGSWFIQDGVVYLHYNEDWLRKEHSNVIAHVSFEFVMNADDTGDGKKVTVNFPGVATSVVIKTKDGSVSGNKFGADPNKEGEMPKFDASDNSYTWTVKVSPSATATNLKIEDVIGSNLDFVTGSFRLIDKSGNPVPGKCDATINGQSATIELGTLSKGDYYVQYKTTVKQSALDALKDGQEVSNVGNTAKWIWGSTGENNGTSGLKDPEKVKYSMVQKSVATDSTNDNIMWAVKLNSGSLKADMSKYQFRDILSGDQKFKEGTKYVVTDASGKQVASGAVDPNSSELNFTLPDGLGKQELTVSYTTTMSNVDSMKAVSNTSKVTPPNDKGMAGEGSASYQPTDGRTYVTKRLVDASTAENDGKASWESTVKFSSMDADTDPSTVVFVDSIEKKPNFEHMKFSDIAVKTDGGTELTKGIDYFVDGGEYSNITIRFKSTDEVKSLIGTHDVVVSYVTTCSGANGTYINTSSVKIGNVDKGSASDSFVIDKEIAPAVSKKSTGDAQWKADYTWPDGSKGAWIANWEVHVNCDEPNTWTHNAASDLKGDNVVVKDKLDEGMSYVSGSSRYWKYGSEGYKTAGDWPELHAEPSDSNGAVVFTIPTRDMVNEAGSWKGYVKLTYQTAIKQSAVDAGVSKDFFNTAEARAGETHFPEGTGKVTINNKVLDKQAVRASDNSHVKYTITVNPNAQTLGASGSLTLVDTMNAGASFTNGTLKVTDKDGKEVTDGVSYTLKNQPNSDGSTSTVLTLTVPDAQALTVTYDVAPQGALGTEVQIENNVSMQGFASASAEHSQKWAVQKSNAGTDATSYGITVIKTDETGKEPLEGAEFTLYQIDLDKSTKDNLVRSKVAIVGDNPKTTGKNGIAKFGDKEHPLDAATLYCYEETKAPAGYKISNTAPTYVMFSGTSEQVKADYAAAFAKAQLLGITPNSGTTFSVFDEKDTEPTGSVELNVVKRVNGADPVNDERFEFSVAGENDASKAKMPEHDSAATIGANAASFGAINFTKEDIGKTYTYAIHETSSAPDDGNVWTMAGDVVATVKVGTPTDAAPTVIPVAVEYSNANADGTAALFNNTWIAPNPAAAQLKVHKTVEAPAGSNVSADEQFTFELYKADAQGKKTEEKVGGAVSVKNGETASFADLSFDTAGTYNYVIHETGHNGNGWTPAADVNVQVVVKKSGDGKSFVIDSITYDGENTDSANFVDMYKAEKTSVSLAAKKTLEGAVLAANQFSFQLKDANGNILQTKSNDTEGNVAFDAIEYTAPGTYEYGICESKGAELGVVYDETEHAAKVVVTDDGQGQLHAAVSYDGDGTNAPAFKNTYAKPAPTSTSFTAQVKKVLDGGRDLKADEFTFVLKKGDKEVSRTTNAADGSVVFKDVAINSVSDGGEYTISEVEGTDSSIEYSSQVVKVNVDVAEKDGKLVATVTYGDSKSTEAQTITNTFRPVATAATVEASKTLSGRALKAGEFTFQLKSGDEVVATATNDVDGKVVFPDEALTYNVVGEHDYVLSEIAKDEADAKGVTYDTKQVKVHVSVTQDSTTGEFSAKTTYDGSETVPAFANTYAAIGSATLNVVKTVNGQVPGADARFDFKLEAKTPGAPMPEKNIVQTVGGEPVSFGGIEFGLADAGKTYEYVIAETTPATTGWTMAQPVTAKVTVGVDNGDGTLGANSVEYSCAAADDSAALFDNKYEQASGVFQLGLVKTVNGGAPKAGETFGFSATAEGTNASDAPKLENATTDADGKAVFAVVELSDKDAGEIYTYRIHEEGDLGEGWVKAPDVVATVKVLKRNADNRLVATVIYKQDAEGAQPYEGAARFDNKYEEQPPTPGDPQTPGDSRTPDVPHGGFFAKTSDPTHMLAQGIFGLASVVAAVACAVSLRRLRKRSE